MNRVPCSKRENNALRFPGSLLALPIVFCLGLSSPSPAGQDPQNKKPAAAAPKAPAAVPGKTHSSVAILSIAGSSRLDLGEETLSFSSRTTPAILKAGPNSHRLEDLLFLDFQPAGEKKKPAALKEMAEVVLSNGDHFWATPLGIEPIKEDDFLIAACAGISQQVSQKKGQLRLDLLGVRLLLYRNAFTSERQWSRFRNGLLKTPTKNDVAHLSAGTRLTGFLEELKRGSILFSADGVGEVKLAAGKVRALEFAAIDEETPSGKKKGTTGARVAVFLRDGGTLRGELKSIGEKSLALNHKLLGAVSLPLSQLAQVSFLGGRCQYLSDMKPAKTREHLGSLFLARLPFRQDSNVLGNPLKMGGKTYPKGLGVHAYSRLDYDIAKGFKKFQATIGLDDSARPVSQPAAEKSTGAVVFRVLLDGKLLKEKPMRFSDSPLDLDLDIAGGSLLSLEVDFGGKDSSAALDRANWCGARVIK